ncbi:MAG: helix-turn-helix domain-containing protein, partial [Candidatus Zixiibacteriota bacterium]
MRVAQDIILSNKERMTLHLWSQGRRVSVRQSERAGMILLAAEGMLNKEIASRMGVKAHTVGRWRSR